MGSICLFGYIKFFSFFIKWLFFSIVKFLVFFKRGFICLYNRGLYFWNFGKSRREFCLYGAISYIINIEFKRVFKI